MVAQAIFHACQMSIFSLTIYQHGLYTLTNYLKSTITNSLFQDRLHDHLVLINDSLILLYVTLRCGRFHVSHIYK